MREVSPRRGLKLGRVLDLVAECTVTCADVAMSVSKDAVVITQCPPAVLIAIMAEAAKKAEPGIQPHDICAGRGGVVISLS